MADPLPVPISSLKLPPEQQSFFRMREIPEAFLLKLNHLNLVLAASQETQPRPKATQLLQDLRGVAASICEKLFRVMFICNDFAGSYLRLLVSFSAAPAEQSTFDEMNYVSFWASSTAKVIEDAHQAMLQFREDVINTVRQITAELTETKPTQDTNTTGEIVFTAENAQVVNDLVGLATECNSLLMQTAKYYRDMEERLLDVESVKSSPPPAEEIETIRQRWVGFTKDLENLSSGIGKLRGSLLRTPDVYRADKQHFHPHSSSAEPSPPTPGEPQAQPPATPNPYPPTQRKAILAITDSADPAADDSAPPNSSPPKTSFFRRLFSCLSLKHFT